MYFCCVSFFFFFNDTATTEIYTLSLHDALPIYGLREPGLVTDRSVTNSGGSFVATVVTHTKRTAKPRWHRRKERSEEHTSELQSLAYLVCRLLLEKKKQH